VIKVVEEIKQAGVKMLRDKEWREVDSIMYKKEKIYIVMRTPSRKKSPMHLNT